MNERRGVATSSADGAWPSAPRAWFAVAILVLAFVFSFVDRLIIGMLVDPIRQDLDISDFGIGMLQGLLFALFYAAVGIPISRLSDQFSRRWIIATGIFVWSVMTAACGLARNFMGLFLARVGVGVGQAALSPAAYSMISDYFPKEKLGRALGTYQAGAFFGAGFAFLVGGLVIRYFVDIGDISVPVLGVLKPWQMTFIAVGLPGVLVALLMFTVREPVRRGKVAGFEHGLPIARVLDYVRENRQVFLAHFGGFALLAVPITTILTWYPAYFSRVLEYSQAETGLTLGRVLLFVSPAGVYFGGWLVDALSKRGYADAPFRVAIGASILLFPLCFVASTGTDPEMALFWFYPLVFCASLSMAVAPAALQIMAPNQMRAQISATWMLVLNIVTAGIGPSAVGFITEFVLRDDMAIGLSIALVNGVSVPIAGLILWSGLRPFRAAIAETGRT